MTRSPHDNYFSDSSNPFQPTSHVVASVSLRLLDNHNSELSRHAGKFAARKSNFSEFHSPSGLLYALLSTWESPCHPLPLSHFSNWYRQSMVCRWYLHLQMRKYYFRDNWNVGLGFLNGDFREDFQFKFTIFLWNPLQEQSSIQTNRREMHFWFLLALF